jgi:hypothetical protein
MSLQIEKWEFFELSLSHQYPGNPFLDVTLAATFTHAERRVDVDGFYDGEGIFKIRCMPDQEGEWQFITHSNVPALDNQRGEFLCMAPSADNHGPVRVSNQTHFAYEDGTSYVPVGTTCYVWNLQGDELEEQTLETLDKAPFNKMRMCVFPKRYSFNYNEPPRYPFPGRVTSEWDPALFQNYRFSEPPSYWDFSQFSPEYFQHLEKRILDLQVRGIEADIIIFHPYDAGAWGFDRMPSEVNDRYLRYLVARLSSFRNVWWSFANEYDLFFERKMEDWDHYMQFVQQIDPYNHLRSIHNCGSFYDHTNPWVTHCSIQSHVLNRVPVWLKMYQKPVVVDECGYEGNLNMVWGDLSAEEMVQRLWLGFVSGGYVGHGETYINEQEILWWSKGGQLYGESVPRIAFLREIFEQAPMLTPVNKSDNEFNNLMDPSDSPQLIDIDKIIPEGLWNIEAGGYNSDKGYCIFYFGMHQPAWRNFNLEHGSYRIDVIDTWNMTIKTAALNAAGVTRVELPARKYMAIRIQRIDEHTMSA